MRCAALRGRLRVGSIRHGVLFVPFHYGYGAPLPAAPRPRVLWRVPRELIATV
ncbi:hypothetical protein [Streptomyces vinaceus]|uniref:hypothetical protein n=1 Tax=Streptomyces vinaceus TaxID=1960 RepID=UPI00142F18CF|nr:hypothetical protein [Streptomyces vinaceus]GHE45103.1 hypothetical protein GCM10017778_30800 [Streptomyces vinaceus]